MPELPEVETTLRALQPHLVGGCVDAARVYQRQLRARIAPGAEQALVGSRIAELSRRGKYLLFSFDRPRAGARLLVHLGMSGSLRLCAADEERRKHDHVELEINQHLLRYHDPRRFGLFEYLEPGQESRWLSRLGVEPLERAFNGNYLERLCRGRQRPIKNLLMDANLVVGVGNIYACEALFGAGIAPQRAAHSLSSADCQALVREVKKVLRRAIKAGGTTLRDFVSGHSRPGYFAQSLSVYGRAGADCVQCGAAIQSLRLANRSTFFCPRCQN